MRNSIYLCDDIDRITELQCKIVYLIHNQYRKKQGRTFGALIKSFLQLAGPLNEDYLPMYNTPAGSKSYIACMHSVL